MSIDQPTESSRSGPWVKAPSTGEGGASPPPPTATQPQGYQPPAPPTGPYGSPSGPSPYRPPASGGRGKTPLIIGGAVVAVLVVIAAAVLLLSGGDDDEPSNSAGSSVSTEAGTGTDGGQAAEGGQGGEGDASGGATSTEAPPPTDAPADGSTVDLGSGVTVTPAEGFSVATQEGFTTILAGPDGALLTVVQYTADDTTTAQGLADTAIPELTGSLSDVVPEPVEAHDNPPASVSEAGIATYTATADGTPVEAAVFIYVRPEDSTGIVVEAYAPSDTYPQDAMVAMVTSIEATI